MSRAAVPRTDTSLAEGAYVMPTIFDNVGIDMRISREEIFGPVVSIIPFDYGGGGGPARERHAVRPLRLDLVARHRQGDPRRKGRPGGGSLDQLEQLGPHRGARSAATRCPGWAGSSGCTALDLYTEVKNIFVDLR